MHIIFSNNTFTKAQIKIACICNLTDIRNQFSINELVVSNSFYFVIMADFKIMILSTQRKIDSKPQYLDISR